VHQDRLWSLFLQPLKKNFWQVPWFHIKSELFKPRAFSTWESHMVLHTHSIYKVNPTCWRQKIISFDLFWVKHCSYKCTSKAGYHHA
jgi:hypothetical protein